MLVAHTNFLTGIGPTWINRGLQATAPANADWVRVVIFASGVGGNGALQFDDLRLDPTNVHTLTVQSPHGSPAPGVGGHLFDHGKLITNSVNSPVDSGSTQYVCTGWSLAGNAPTSGTGHVMTMTITNNAVLAWRWTTNLLSPSFLSLVPLSPLRRRSRHAGFSDGYPDRQQQRRGERELPDGRRHGRGRARLRSRHRNGLSRRRGDEPHGGHGVTSRPAV